LKATARCATITCVTCQTCNDCPPTIAL
jgi:hypothetical protein